MKKIIQGIAVASLFLSLRASAIEHLQISVQCSNVVLRWPCLDDGSESFIVQYRQTLSPGDGWQTLETSLPAVFGTNMMYYVHSNVVQHPNCGAGGGFGGFAPMMASGGNDSLLLGLPLAMPTNGSGAAVPLVIYPPGMDMSGFSVFDPNALEWMSWEVYNLLYGDGGYQLNGIDPNGPDPGGGGGGGGGGDGSPPEAAFYRVVRVGPHLIGITNNMILSGVVKIPVEVGGTDGYLANLTLTENGSPAGDASIHQSPFELPVPLVTLDTSLMINGVHQIAALARWQIPSGTNESGGGFYEADCPPISVVVSNEISFVNWMPNFGELGNTLLITAQSAHTNTDWQIDVYGANAGYIGTFTGHTFDGSIYGWWDLTGPPPTFIQYTNEPWFQFKVSTPYIDPPSPKTYKQADPWPGPGGWVAVSHHAFDYVSDHDTLYQAIDGYIGMAQGGGLTVRPSPVSGSAFPIRFRDPSADLDWAAFRQALYHPHSRNLIYFGHGGPNGLGFDHSNTNRSILAPEIANMLHTIPNGQTNRHSYRMVIVDGCSTGSGTLPESFGIIHKQNVSSIDYANASMRLSSYCGWSGDKAVDFLNGSAPNYDHIHFIQWIQFFMAQGEGIKQAKDHAAGMPDVIFVATGEFKIFGSWDLTFFGQNN